MNNEILWIFSSKNPLSIPSYIVGGIMPADFLKIQKIIFLENHDPDKFFLNHKPKIIIIGKAFHAGVYDLAKKAHKYGVKVISIFDDWHFENENNLTRERSELNLKLLELSTVTIAKTKAASELIYNKTNAVTKIIPDCIRYKTLNTTNDFGYPHKICWFGNYTNHKTIIKGINQIKTSKEKVDLKVITNKIQNIELAKDFLDKNISIDFVEWKINLHDLVKNSEIVIIPLFENNKSYVKSSNRIVDSLNMGRFIIMNDNIQFEEFKKYCYFGDIGEGLQWVKKNKNIAKQMIVEGQKYVLQNYTLKEICKKWKMILDNL
tara:strand:+ start:279 stop:1238 length:960 start_codon:yes stop_codon:yes gene_type:complete